MSPSINKPTAPFSSKVDKIGIFKAEEKRIQQLYGEKQGLKYKIKLNDEILDKNGKSMSAQEKGKLHRGMNFENLETKHKVSPIVGRDLFNTSMQADVGPADYDPKKTLPRPK